MFPYCIVMVNICIYGGCSPTKRSKANAFPSRFMQAIRCTLVSLYFISYLSLYLTAHFFLACDLISKLFANILISFIILFYFSIGYPVVTLGFGFKSYVSYRIRQVILYLYNNDKNVYFIGSELFNFCFSKYFSEGKEILEKRMVFI